MSQRQRVCDTIWFVPIPFWPKKSILRLISGGNSVDYKHLHMFFAYHNIWQMSNFRHAISLFISHFTFVICIWWILTIFFHIIFPSLHRREAKFLHLKQHFRMPPNAHHISMHHAVFKSIQQCMQKITSHQRDRTQMHTLTSYTLHIHLTNTIPRHADYK